MVFQKCSSSANYNNLRAGIHATSEFLELFFENLLMDAKHDLKNRYMHIDFDGQSANNSVSKCQNGTLEISLEELAIINALKTNPALTQKQISELVGKSERTIKRCTVEMQEKGLIARENGKRNGKWKILIEA